VGAFNGHGLAQLVASGSGPVGASPGSGRGSAAQRPLPLRLGQPAGRFKQSAPRWRRPSVSSTASSKLCPPRLDAGDARGQHAGEAALIEAAGSISMLFSARQQAELAVQAAEQAPICSGVSKEGVPTAQVTRVERAALMGHC